MDPALEENPVAGTILRQLSPVPAYHIVDRDALIHELNSYGDDPRYEGKQILLIDRYAGQLVKDCPGTKGHICCGYKVINVVTNCPMDCSYCILQVYLNNPFVTVYPEFDKIFGEIEEIMNEKSHHFFRFGTGELGDSLVLDQITGFSREAVPFFAGKHNGILELKTKAADVDHLLSLDHRGKTVVSWSLNPAKLVQEEEFHTASLHERMQAARRCQNAGYFLGFHFDPLVCYPGWQEDYRELVDLLFQHVDPRGILWISLGGLRFPPSLKKTAHERFPKTKVFSGELVPGDDGKFRYLKPIRVEMYRKMLSWLREYDPNLFVYLCMERGDVWQAVYGTSPKHTAGLNRRFEQRIIDAWRSRT